MTKALKKRKMPTILITVKKIQHKFVFLYVINKSLSSNTVFSLLDSEDLPKKTT